VFGTGQYCFGQYTKSFAQKFAERCAAEHCLPVANGTDAIELALRSLSLDERSACLTVANAGGYTSTACHLVGIRPEYIDIEPRFHLIDLDSLKCKLTPDVRVLVLTHLYGNIVDVKKVRELLSFLERPDVAIIEDCAQAHGGRYPSGEPIGSLADVSTYSFYPTKNLGAMGDAGAVVTNRRDIFNRLKALHQYGWTDRYICDQVGGRNSRIDEVQAAVLSVKLLYLESWNAKRRSVVEYYKQTLPAEIQVIASADSNCVGHLAVCWHPDRDRILAELEKSNIYGAIHYPVLDFQQKAWMSHADVEDSMEVSVSTRKGLFTLPCFPEITSAELERTVNSVRRAFV
jgi:dTDP-4-amino-4,6-dideoxygalactose transaminase